MIYHDPHPWVDFQLLDSIAVAFPSFLAWLEVSAHGGDRQGSAIGHLSEGRELLPL